MRTAFFSKNLLTGFVGGMLAYNVWVPAWAGSSQSAHGVGTQAAPAAACAALLRNDATQRAWQLVRTQMQSQGLRLVAHACPVRVQRGNKVQALQVQVIVVNADRAEMHVRGPLVEGFPVDVGSLADQEAEAAQKAAWASHNAWVEDADALVSAASEPWEMESYTPSVPADPSTEAAQEVSPDVEFNRQWLLHIMQSRGFVPVRGEWGVFTPPAKVADKVLH